MDGTMFMKWVDIRLIPAFKAKYPGKTMILILDNAPYHHETTDGVRLADKNIESSAC